MRKKHKLFIGLALILSLSGCADNPDDSIIQNKDFDNLIEEAENTEESVNMEEMSQDVETNYNTYETTITDDNLHVTVNVNAQVDIPATEQLSVYRVKEQMVTQEMLDKVRMTLIPDISLYDKVLLEQKTKSELENDIKNDKYNIEYLEAELEKENLDDVIRQEREQILADYKEDMANAQASYDSAPEEHIFEGYESDYLIKNASDKSAEYPGSIYGNYYLNLESDIQVYSAISDGEDGNYIELYAQNSEYGNTIRYRKSIYGYSQGISLVLVGIHSGMRDNMWLKGSDIPENAHMSEGKLDEYGYDTVTISEEDGKHQADKLLQDMGISDFSCVEGDIYCELIGKEFLWADETGEHYSPHYCRELYVFKYVRTMDNTFIDNGTDMKHSEGWEGNDYRKSSWGNEEILIYVNDDGIVGFDYNYPTEIVDTVVAKTQMKSFEDIQSIFEEMVAIKHATEWGYNTIHIDRVELRYYRISEADNFETGLLVPVWDFIGTKTFEGNSNDVIIDNDSVLKINAIDGTVIDEELGY
ncbi:MAG: hypothetical protein IJO70_02875 [Lachnospiraceae bacterium]|nr:hypothetical protein [Lachnospiraceae bacterium]